jgi:hypothetical protein
MPLQGEKTFSVEEGKGNYLGSFNSTHDVFPVDNFLTVEYSRQKETVDTLMGQEFPGFDPKKTVPIKL